MLLALADTLWDEVLPAGRVFYIIHLRVTALILPFADSVRVLIHQDLHRCSMARIRALTRAQEDTRREAEVATFARGMAQEANRIRDSAIESSQQAWQAVRTTENTENRTWEDAGKLRRASPSSRLRWPTRQRPITGSLMP